MADLGEGPVGPGLPLIVRPPPPLPLSEGLHPPLRRVLSYQTRPPDLQIRGLGGGGGGGCGHPYLR